MGTTENKKISRKRGCLIALIASPVALAIVGGVVAHFAGGAGGGAVDPLAKAEQTRADRDRHTLAAGRAAIIAILKDPGSAEFGRSFGWLKHGEHVACGYINGKNSFGAMAGETEWLVRVDKGIAMAQAIDNAGPFASAWNRFCVGVTDDLKAPPDAFLGVTFGDRVPGSLRPYNADKQVWLFRDASPRTFLDVPIIEPTFMTDGGRVFGAQATAKGKAAYDRLRQKMFDAYGIPTSDGGADDTRMSWDWGKGKMLAQLTYNADHDQTTMSLTRQE